MENTEPLGYRVYCQCRHCSDHFVILFPCVEELSLLYCPPCLNEFLAQPIQHYTEDQEVQNEEPVYPGSRTDRPV